MTISNEAPATVTVAPSSRESGWLNLAEADSAALSYGISTLKEAVESGLPKVHHWKDDKGGDYWFEPGTLGDWITDQRLKRRGNVSPA